MPIATKGSKVDISSEKKLEEFSKKLSVKLKKGDILFLYGEMGVGKTTFVKYLINDLQLRSRLKLTEVTSPTFNILNEYKINDIRINHYDLYRLKDLRELADLNLFGNNQNLITVIEWPEIIKAKPKNLIEIFFKYNNDYSKRFLQIKS